MEIHPKLKYWVDILMAIAFVLSGLSGIIMYFVPWGIQVNILGISRSVWPVIHEWSSFSMVALVIIHLIFNWNWIVSMTKEFFIKK